jgi:hypothetical protein
MRLILLAFLISSCSPRTEDNNALPRYSDMGAATDAGQVK